MAAMLTSGGHVLLPLLLLLLLPLLAALAGGEHSDCSSLRCLHDSPCLTTVSHGNRHPAPAHARCLCRGHWAGPRCQYRIHVTAAKVTSHAVHLEVAMVDSLTSSPADGGPEEGETTSRPEAGTGKGDHSEQQNRHQSYLSSTNTQVRQGGLVSAAQYRLSNYTITYWSNSSRRTCRLLQELTSPSPRVQGLQPNSLYLFCAESGSLDSCAPSAADVTSDDTNCVKVVTPAASDLDDPDSEPEVQAQEAWRDVPTMVVVTVATVVLVVVVLAAVLVFRWFHLLTVRQLCSLCCNRNKEVASFERFHREALDSDRQHHQHQHQDLEYYAARAMPLPPAVDFPPPSPDLSLHSRNGGGGAGGRRARGGGLGGRSLSHRVMLEAVLEDPAGDSGDVTETSLMVEPSQEGSDCLPGDVTEVSPMMAPCDDVRETSLMIPACDDVRETSLMMPGCDDVSVLPSAYTSPIMRHDMVT